MYIVVGVLWIYNEYQLLNEMLQISDICELRVDDDLLVVDLIKMYRKVLLRGYQLTNLD
jgi:hypothetical protein